jgi:hypothetical protein
MVDNEMLLTATPNSLVPPTLRVGTSVDAVHGDPD